jgi:hypothetical protein
MVKLKAHMTNRPLILAVIFAAAVGLVVLNTVWDRASVASEEAAGIQATHSDWTNCTRVQVPLEMTLDIHNVIENQGGAQEHGGLVEVQLGVKPLLETKELSWHLVLPEGITTYSGPDSWSGMVSKDQIASFVMTLSVPDGKEYYVDAVAEYTSDAGASVRKAMSLKMDLGEAEPAAHPSFIRVDERGRSVVSYKGNVTGGGQ